MVLTPEDLQALKEVFATKEDLAKLATKDDLATFATEDDLASLRLHIGAVMDKQLEALATTLRQELEIMKSAILDGVRSFLEANITPFISNHEQRLQRIEDHLDLPPTSPTS